MARGDITIRQEVRPCLAYFWEEGAFVGKRGLWHMWRDDGKWGIIEMRDGTIAFAEPTNVKFLDSDWVFGEFGWEDDDDDR